MKRIISVLAALSLAGVLSCDDASDTDGDHVSSYRVNVVNDSSYAVAGLSLNLVDGKGLNEAWEIEEIGIGGITDYHDFQFVEAKPGQAVPGTYGCYDGEYMFNDDHRDILICYPNLLADMTIYINDIDYSYQ